MSTSADEVRLGYACRNARLPTAAGTCRLSNATPERLEAVGRANLVALDAILRWNLERGIVVFRVSSNTIPFASHPAVAFAWRERLAPELASLARLVRRQRLRLSLHPSQYVVLNSPRPEAREAARAELAYHAELLEALGAGPAAKIVLHVGGAYGDKAAALESFTSEARALPAAVRRRLVVENDDVRFTLADVLGVSERAGVPVVLDLFHHDLLPSLSGAGAADLARRAAETWNRADGRPEVHLSHQARGRRRGAHSISIRPSLAVPVVRELASAVRRDRRCGGPLAAGLDLVLETKDKERSVLALRRALADSR